ncbi:amidohydrolase family protein [Aliiglaciecola lipolytica]|uniref:amidohydrolase family protein n=1 Tax=Aliiglaciecola lipolytica TaxID=477689 RepID=UPI001C09A721|nr:amidohydrolase family protein [Aliiglaciecola lipolytica]MBU2877673.1 amidohydrolase family protein [Aliiglaciecola lipolytica]
MIKYIFAVVFALVVGTLVVLVFTLPTPTALTDVEADKSETHATNTVLLKNLRVFDGHKRIEHTSILIEDGFIVKIADINSDEMNDAVKGNDINVIEGQNLTVIPGIIDAHTHSYGDALKDALRLGVTTHLDMFTNESWLIKHKASSQLPLQTDKADLFSSGTLATVKNGHGTQFGFSIDTVDSMEEIAEWVAKRKNAGADYIKLVYMPDQQYIPSLDKPTAIEIIKQGHLQGLKVMAHISTQSAAKDLIEADIDGLVHIFADQVVSDEVVALAAQKDIFIIPTLAVIASVNQQQRNSKLLADERISTKLSSQQKNTLQASFNSTASGFDFAIAKQNVLRFNQAGVTILSGSDAPNSGTAYGVSAYHEITLLVEAGMTPSEALSAATSAAAKRFNLQDRGTIEIGKRADLVIVTGDPTANIDNIFNIKHILKNGFEIQQYLPETTKGTPLKTALLGDFEGPDSLQYNDDFNWGHTDDRVANGNSITTIALQEFAGMNNSGGLHVSAAVNSGFPYPWAGAALGDFSPPINGVDISAFDTLVFDVKGSVGNYRVLSFSAISSGIPPSQNFEITEQWQTVRLPLLGFKGLDHTTLSGLAFVAGPTLGEFEFILDNVHLE